LVGEYIARLTTFEEIAGFGRVLTEAQSAACDDAIPSLAWLDCVATTPSDRVDRVWDELQRAQAAGALAVHPYHETQE